MSVLINLNPTETNLGGGATAAAGTGSQWNVTIGGTFAVGDLATLLLTDTQTGIITQAGAGNITGVTPTFCYTYNNKEYILGGSTVYFSAIGDPTTWNDPNGQGNSFITFSDWFSTQEPLTSIAPFQGQLLFTSRRTTQIWTVDPDPANYTQTQVLPNIGTQAPLSVQPIGDMDVYMLADNGVRSVRVRVASNNAQVVDVGSPIDDILRPILASLTNAQIATCCGTVEPQSNRYWLYVPGASNTQGYIYVFSNFSNDEIAAWSTYLPSFETTIAPNNGPNGWTGLTIGKQYCWSSGSTVTSFVSGTTTLNKLQSATFTATATTATVTGTNNGTLTLITPFIPVQFVVFNGQIYALDSGGNFYAYGGSNNNTYSPCGMTATCPYVDSGQPATNKWFGAIDAALQGNWQIQLSPDFNLQKYKPVAWPSISTFQNQRLPVQSQGTHYSLQALEGGTGYAKLSSMIVHLEESNKK